MHRPHKTHSVLSADNSTVVELYTPCLSAIATTTLLSVSIISLLVPITMFILLLTLGSGGFGLGFIICTTIFLLSFMYMSRLYLWNRFGKEVFIIEDGHFVHYYDYKLFTSNSDETTYSTVQIYFLLDDAWRNAAETDPETLIDLIEKLNLKSEDTESPIRFEVDDKLFDSHIKLPIHNIIEIASKL